MSDSAKQAIGTIGGAIIGFVAAGPVGALKGAAIGYGIGTSFTVTQLDAVEGPRVDDLAFQTADYNINILRSYGNSEIAGNLIWLEGNKIKESAHTDTIKQGGKGGGGSAQTTSTYTYSATFAVGICENAIAGVGQIYADSTLIYDGLSDDPSVLAAAADFSSKMTIYKGSDNEIDPLIEAEQGSEIPAFRNLSYVVFEDIQLAEFGNRIPNLRFVISDDISGIELNSDAMRALPNSDSFPDSVIDPGTASDIAGLPWWFENGILHVLRVHDQGSGSVAFPNPSTAGTTVHTNVHKIILQRIDADSTGVLLSEEELTLPANALFGGVFGSDYTNVRVYAIPNSPGLMLISWRATSGIYHLGVGYYQSGGDIAVFKAGSLYQTTKIFASKPIMCYSQGDIFMITDGFSAIANGQTEGVEGIIKISTTGTPPIAAPVNNATDAANYEANIYQSLQNTSNTYFALGADLLVGDIYAVHNNSGGTNNLVVQIAASNLIVQNTGIIIGLEVSTGQLFVSNGNVSYIDSTTTLLKTITPKVIPIAPTVSAILAVGTIATAVTEDATVIWYSQLSFLLRDSVSPNAEYGNPNNALQDLYGTGVSYTPSVTNITIEQVLQEEISRNPFLNFGDIDVTGIASESLVGYTLNNRGSNASTIKPLMMAYQFDVYEEDYKLKFKSRSNGSNVATISTADLEAHEIGSATPPQAITMIQSDYTIPALVNVSYIDADRNHEPASQQAERLNTISDSTQDVNLPMSLGADKASQIADILLKTAWLEAQATVEIKTSFKYSHLERTDLITVSTDNNTYNLRIVDIEKGKPGIVIIKAVLNDTNSYSSASVGDTGNIVPAVLAQNSSSELKVIDCVALNNSDGDFGFYYSVFPTDPNGAWGGATISSSADYNKWLQIGTIFLAVTNGTATDALNGTQRTDVFDSSDTLNINLTSGTLSSASEALVRAGDNTLAYGTNLRWELIKFTTATLEANGTFTISNILRGYMGTEVHMGDHIAGDQVILLEDSTLRRLPIRDSSLFNIAQYYIATTLNRVFNRSRATIHTNKAEAAIHRAPSQIRTSRASDAITIYWHRAKRVNREWTQTAWITTDTFDFEIDILNGAGGAVLRTISVTGSNDFNTVYSSAQQTTDFGSPQTSLFFDMYQVDATTGRGKVGQGLGI